MQAIFIITGRLTGGESLQVSSQRFCEVNMIFEAFETGPQRDKVELLPA